ncbi:hypothetical protein MKX03_009662 [Papaver bracteatum]|nr:hypothetical protein MKX03_009662 [Papaver bracteatum]
MKLVIVLTLFCFFGNALSNDAIPTTKHYIVYMGDHSQLNPQSIISSSICLNHVHQAKEAVVHHYSKSFRGFSAMLTEEQAQQLSQKESVISVFESKTNRLHTTHSWEFLGVEGSLQQNKPTTGYEYDVIVGVIDSGLPSSATNVAPWILTVAASSIDRYFFSNVYLGNSKILQGTSLNPLKMDKYCGIVLAISAATTGEPPKNAGFCTKNTLDQDLIKGKIVVCTIETATDNRREKGIVVRDGGGVGMILIDPLLIDVGFQFVIPATLIGQNEALVLQEYLSTEKTILILGPNVFNRNPTGKILPTATVFKTSPAPAMAVFSSMGPNVITPDILKPDITAPGVNILAAWSPVAIDGAGGRSVDYNIISGTSMSCPHISAVAAVIKTSVMNSTLKPILRDPIGSPTTPFDFGSGHVNPVAALDPGLIYDYGASDILNFLCGAGATGAEIRNLTGAPFHCNPIPSYDLNYPSIGVSNMNGSVSVLRTVTYYGYGPTVFKPFVESPSGVKVRVTPHKLKFKEAGEKMSFRVRFMPYKNSNGSFVFGSITWSDGIYHVRSPIGLNVISV